MTDQKWRVLDSPAKAAAETHPPVRAGVSKLGGKKAGLRISLLIRNDVMQALLGTSESKVEDGFEVMIGEASDVRELIRIECAEKEGRYKASRMATGSNPKAPPTWRFILAADSRCPIDAKPQLRCDWKIVAKGLEITMPSWFYTKANSPGAIHPLREAGRPLARVQGGR